MSTCTVIEESVEIGISAEILHSLIWAEHFRTNAEEQLYIPWDDAVPLADEERDILIRSLQDFQLGESSEGRHSLARAAAYGERIGDPHYVKTMGLFFAEENRHAAYLARYLDIQGSPLIGHSWTDFIFRRLRRLMGLETLLTVLLSVELIAEVYYRAIRNATRCPAIRGICAQIIRDEKRHVQFHVERFAMLRKGHSRVHNRIHAKLWRWFFAATCVAAWAKHGRAFQLGGYSFAEYWTEAWRRFRSAGTRCALRKFRTADSQSSGPPARRCSL